MCSSSRQPNQIEQIETEINFHGTLARWPGASSQQSKRMTTKQKYDLRGIARDPNLWIVVPDFDASPADVEGKGFDCFILDPAIERPFQESISNIIWFMRDKAKRHFASLSDLMVAFNRLHLGEKKFNAATDDEWFAYGYVCVFHFLERWFDAHSRGRSDSSLLLAQLSEQILYMFSAGPHDPKSIGDLRTAFAKQGAAAKLSRSPQQQEKQLVRDCWDTWQQRPATYKGKAAFARDMLSKCESLKSPRVIERWCREWELEA